MLPEESYSIVKNVHVCVYVIRQGKYIPEYSTTEKEREVRKYTQIR